MIDWYYTLPTDMLTNSARGVILKHAFDRQTNLCCNRMHHAIYCYPSATMPDNLQLWKRNHQVDHYPSRCFSWGQHVPISILHQVICDLQSTKEHLNKKTKVIPIMWTNYEWLKITQGGVEFVHLFLEWGNIFFGGVIIFMSNSSHNLKNLHMNVL